MHHSAIVHTAYASTWGLIYICHTELVVRLWLGCSCRYTISTKVSSGDKVKGERDKFITVVCRRNTGEKSIEAAFHVLNFSKGDNEVEKLLAGFGNVAAANITELPELKQLFDMLVQRKNQVEMSKDTQGARIYQRSLEVSKQTLLEIMVRFSCFCLCLHALLNQVSCSLLISSSYLLVK